MKTTIILFAALSGFLHAQGPLTPPAGPAPTMKSLDQIEPRTAISSLPFVNSKSGSYYFTGNLVYTEDEGDAITITASNVTVDLMGFTLSSKASVTGSGINCSIRDSRGITIRNGNIVGNTAVTTDHSPPTWSVSPAGFENGIRDQSTSANFKNLVIIGGRFRGIYSIANSKIDNVRVEQCGDDGIQTHGGAVTNSISRANGGSGIVAQFGIVTNSIARTNGDRGISAVFGTVTNSRASSNGATGIHANFGIVTNSNSRINGATGISADGGSVRDSRSSANDSDGIDANGGSVINSTASSNEGEGIIVSSGTVTNSTATGNGGNGISAANGSVSNSTATTNENSGISAFRGNVTGSSASDNGSDGIYASTGSVTSCTASSNGSYDISASNAVVAFSRFTTFLMNASSRTGNFPSP